MEGLEKIITISHSNAFINGVFEMSTLELRIFVSLLSKHKEGEDVFKYPVYLSPKDIGIDIDSGQFSRFLKSFVDRLSQIRFKYETGSRYEPLHIFSPALDKTDKIVEVKLSKDIEDLVNVWTEKFTEADVQTLMDLPSFPSYRIYMLLKQYQTYQDKREITLDKLRQMLCIEDSKSYKLYGSIKQRILNPAKIHLSGTDMAFDFEEIKRGRAVHSLIFHFKKQPKKLKPVKTIQLPSPDKPKYKKTEFISGQTVVKKWNKAEFPIMFPDRTLEESVKYFLSIGFIDKGDYMEEIKQG